MNLPKLNETVTSEVNADEKILRILHQLDGD